MIDHVTVPVSQLDRSKRFYQDAFRPLGFDVAFGEDGVFWAFAVGKGLFEICRHRGAGAPTSFHVAFRVKSHDEVRAFHRAALAAGGTDNGPPGPRPHYTPAYYACFVHDPDGHNIEAVFDEWTD